MTRHKTRRSSSLLAASAAAALALVHGSGVGAQTVETTVPQVATAPPGPTVAARNVTTFVDLGWTYERNSRTNGIVGNLSKDRTWQATAGIDVTVTPWLALGGGLTFLDGEGSSGRGFRRYSTDGLTGFLTGTVTLPELFTLQVAGGYGRQDTDQTLLVGGSALPSDYSSWSRFASATISRTFYADDLAIRPFAQLLYAETQNGSYLVGNLVNRASADTLGRTAAGLELSYPFLVSDVLIAPVASAALMYDVNLPDEYRDRTAVDVQAGLNVFRGRLTGGLRYSAVVGRTDYIQHGARFFLAYQF
jgi:hypothetical protein